MECQSCSLLFGNPLPILDPDSINEIYSSAYYNSYFGAGQGYADSGQVSSLKPTHTREIEHIVNFHGGSGGRVLDVGCGDGRYLEIFRAMGWRCFGIEPSEHSRRLAEANGVEVTDQSFLDRATADGRFDIIVMDNVIEHVDRPRQFFEQALRLLNPGGVFVLKTPNRHGLRERIETAVIRWFPDSITDAIMALLHSRYGLGSGRVHRFGNLHPPVHLTVFDPASMRRAATLAGFEDSNVVVTTRSFQASAAVAARSSSGLRSALGLVDQCGSALGMGQMLFALARKPA